MGKSSKKGSISQIPVENGVGVGGKTVKLGNFTVFPPGRGSGWARRRGWNPIFHPAGAKQGPLALEMAVSQATARGGVPELGRKKRPFSRSKTSVAANSGL